ncbi:MAG: CvpA family protein [Fibrobacteraceae bacterium]|nr:CvpA family protein [Fibrobacteraceae bacterium]
MSWIDIVCLVCILILVLFGIYKGFLKSIFKLCAWIGAIFGAYFASDLFGGIIASNFNFSPFTVKLTCIAIGFLIPFLLFTFIGHFLSSAISDTSISKVNRGLGGALGLFKALVICFMFLTVLHLLPLSGSLKETRNNAFFYSAYKFSLEAMGYSSEEIDLVGVAEKKANEISEEITNKAVNAAKETAEEAAQQASEKVKEKISEAKDSIAKVKPVEKTADKVKEKINEKISN